MKRLFLFTLSVIASVATALGAGVLQAERFPVEILFLKNIRSRLRR